MAASTSPPASDNPLLTEARLPAFDRIAAHHVAPAIRALLADAEDGFAALEAAAPTTWAGLMVPLEALGDRLSRPVSAVRLLISTSDSPELREAWQSIEAPLTAFFTRMDQSRPLYEALLALRETEGDQLDPHQRRILDAQILDMRLGGVGLEGEASDRFQVLVQELTALSTQFGNNVLDSQKLWSEHVTDPSRIAGMPDSWRQLAAALAAQDGAPEATPEAGPWRISIDHPVSVPILQHCKHRPLREEVRRRLLAVAGDGETDNTAVVLDILRKRQELARILGFESYARLSLARKMAPSVEAVEERMHGMARAARSAAQAELAELQALAAEHAAPEADDLQPWDVTYWAERLRERKVGLTDDELRPYFSFETVMSALFSLIERVFGARLEPSEGVATWHDEVRTFTVRDVDSGALLADLYVDPFARPGRKRSGAWMSPLVERSARLSGVAGEVRRPVAAVVCNQAPPVPGQPSLMSFREVETLFHEMGHALHQLLTVAEDRRSAGVSGVEWDAVEVPSMFLQSWIYHRPTLRSMARHHETGTPLADAVIARIEAARTHQAASAVLSQADLALSDLDLHHRFDPSGEVELHEHVRELSARTRVMPPLPTDKRMCSFRHLFAGGYAAGYYSYRWAELLALDAFSAFQELEGDTAAEAELGRRWRRTVLAEGGGVHPLELFERFRGRAPTDEALLRWYGLAS